MTAFFDTNVVIAMENIRDRHHEWAIRQFAIFRSAGYILVGDIVYGEIASRFETKDDLDGMLRSYGFKRFPSSDTALFRSGKAFGAYRKRGGPRERLKSDFLIGAVAALEGAPLVTANERDFRSYFPEIQLVCPT